jgi:2-polyprenyl-3-methyl-5-hydroxy-6-metoxy-1,4-benzoquinol methylase
LLNPSIHEEELRRRENAARASEGHSADPILAMVLRILEAEGARGDLLDVGCGRGDLFRRLPPTITSYTGVDLVRYEGFPESPRATLRTSDLNQDLPVGDGVADVVVSIETVEHIENPRALFRELVRAVRPGGLVLVTTPNQLSVLSKLSFVLKDHHAHFQAVHYPAHITALLPSDLMNIGAELKLETPRIVYSDDGRIPGTARHWPAPFKGRLFSDNVAYLARKPVA